MQAQQSIALSNIAQFEPTERVPCPLCGDDAPELVMIGRDRTLGKPGSYPLVQCGSCALRYVSPRPTLSALAAHYPDDYFIYTRPDQVGPLLGAVMRRRNEARVRGYLKRLERIVGTLQPGTKLVDVGCGQNAVVDYLGRARQVDGVGVDFKPELVEYVRDELHLPIIEGTLQQAGFADASFDLVTMNEYLEHEPHPREVLEEARRITKLGGRLAVEVPFIEGLPARMFGSRWSQVDAPRHLVHFTRATLEEMLRRCGYRLVEVKTFQMPLSIGMSVMLALGNRQIGRSGLGMGVLVALASLPFYLAYPLMDEFMLAVAEAV